MVTWNNAPMLLASLGLVSPNTWYEVDLTSLVTADGMYSLRVTDSVGGADYSSKEGSNDPKLLVSLAGAPAQSCAPAATPTATPGPTNTPTNTNTPGPSPTPTITSTPTVAPTPTATVPPPAPFNNATFVYDGDGRRVKSTFNNTSTTYFVGNYYEVTGGTVTKYYYAGAQRIAMRTNGTLNYLLGDHLGSTSLTTNASGQVVSELRYKAWGEVRYASGNIPTQYTFTGQFGYANDFGLMFYNARWLDVSLGRFAQADSIVPAGVQGLDRYAYVQNNPLLYVDPSGHCGIEKETVGKLDCKAKDIAGWSMAYRLRWFKLLTATVRASEWFHNIRGILESFDENNLGETASGEGVDDWYSWTDAGLLESIQNGLTGDTEGNKAAELWNKFFEAVRDRPGDRAYLKELWGDAEEAGINYGEGIAADNGHAVPDDAKDFLLVGDIYRSVTGIPYGGEIVGGGLGALTGSSKRSQRDSDNECQIPHPRRPETSPSVFLRSAIKR